jgi:hypothetical protein
MGWHPSESPLEFRDKLGFSQAVLSACGVVPRKPAASWLEVVEVADCPEQASMPRR